MLSMKIPNFELNIRLLSLGEVFLIFEVAHFSSTSFFSVCDYKFGLPAKCSYLAADITTHRLEWMFRATCLQRTYFLGTAHEVIGNALQISVRVCKVKLAMNLVHVGKISCLCLLS